MDGGETTNSFAFNFFSSSSSSSGGKGEEEKRTETNANETTTTIQKPEAKQVYSKDVFEPVFAKAVDKETVEIFSSDEEEKGAKVLMLSIEKKIPPLGKEEVRMRVPTLDAVCKNNNEKPAKGAKASPSSAASAYSLASHDLVKGKYEGGLKLWECAIDLTSGGVDGDVVDVEIVSSVGTGMRPRRARHREFDGARKDGERW
jgi:hypothetical protein